jgi:hypothetical protein
MPNMLFGHTPSAISDVTFPNELYSFMLDLHFHLPGELNFFFSPKLALYFHFMIVVDG